MKRWLPQLRLSAWTGSEDAGTFEGLCLEIIWLGKLVSVVVATKETPHG